MCLLSILSSTFAWVPFLFWSILQPIYPSTYPSDHPSSHPPSGHSSYPPHQSVHLHIVIHISIHLSMPTCKVNGGYFDGNIFFSLLHLIKGLKGPRAWEPESENDWKVTIFVSLRNQEGCLERSDYPLCVDHQDVFNVMVLGTVVSTNVFLEISHQEIE